MTGKFRNVYCQENVTPRVLWCRSVRLATGVWAKPSCLTSFPSSIFKTGLGVKKPSYQTVTRDESEHFQIQNQENDGWLASFDLCLKWFSPPPPTSIVHSLKESYFSCSKLPSKLCFSSWISFRLYEIEIYHIVQYVKLIFGSANPTLFWRRDFQVHISILYGLILILAKWLLEARCARLSCIGGQAGQYLKKSLIFVTLNPASVPECKRGQMWAQHHRETHIIWVVFVELERGSNLKR